MDKENPTRTRSVFFAYSWDALTGSIYEKEIFSAIHTKYKTNKWNIRAGSNSVTLPKDLGDIEVFRNQNKQLFDIFAKNILLSDVFIADITTLNPNVLIEIGIAIKYNKSVLIVSGISADKLPFDIKGFPIKFYRDLEDLKGKITDYLDMYLRIKEMAFGTKIEGSSFSITSGEIKAPPTTIETGSFDGAFKILPIPTGIPRIKDVKIRANFKITKYNRDDNWFGFLIRSVEENGRYEPVYLGSLLINSRVSGTTDITLFPGNIVLKSESTTQAHNKSEFRPLEIILEANNIKVSGDIRSYEYEPIPLVDFGHIYLACYQCEVEYKDLDILNIDTTSEIV